MKCRVCNKNKKEEEFPFENKSKNIRNTRCKKCHRIYTKKHYVNNKKAYISRSSQRRRDLKIWFRNITNEDSCHFCKENEPVCIDYHHADPTKKEQTISDLLAKIRSKERILKELKKCVAICSNCHRKLHAGKLKLRKNAKRVL